MNSNSRQCSGHRTDCRGGLSLHRGRRSTASLAYWLNNSNNTEDVRTNIESIDGEVNRHGDFAMSVESFECQHKDFVGFVEFHLFSGLFMCFAFTTINGIFSF